MSSAPVRQDLERRLERARAPQAQAVFTELLVESARAEADAADARRRAGICLGPLDGCIVSVKDLFDMAGHVTRAGGRRQATESAAVADAPAVARVRRAGAVLIGRTNMTEYAFSGLGLNPHWGTPGNAVAGERIPGGSTSGGAVSVALGLADVALGSDTGGSTRIPAAFNGIVGFKPTSHRVPTQGVVPLSYTLDSIGPLAGRVALCAAADAVMANEEPEALPVVTLDGARVGMPRGFLFSDTEPDVSRAFDAAMAALIDGGMPTPDVSIDDILGEMRRTLAVAPIVASEAASIHAEALQSRPGDFDPRVLARLQAGRSVRASDYVGALRLRLALRAEFLSRIAHLDAFAVPTVPMVAPLTRPLELDDALFASTNLLALRNTSVANFFDLPAISLPIPGAALPVGLMLVGKPDQDRQLLALAAAVERALASSSPLRDSVRKD